MYADIFRDPYLDQERYLKYQPQFNHNGYDNLKKKLKKMLL